jgi:copper transport protein
MRCEEAREALSVRLDGEPIDDDATDRHLSSCAECSDWLNAAHAVTRRARLLAAPEVPDLTDRIVAAVQADRQQQVVGRKTVTQVALLVVAGLQLMLALPILLGGHDHEAPLHVAHEMGSFNLALAFAYLITGLQPFRAGGLLPFAGIASGLLAVTASADLLGRDTSPSEELPHLLAIGGFFLLWRLLDRSHPNSSTGLRKQLRPAAGRLLRSGQAVLFARISRPRRSRRLAAVLVGAAVTVPLLAVPADAHALLESTDPASGVVLAQSGDAVTMHFSEPVTLLPSGVRVLDGSGKRVDRGDAAHTANSQDVRVGLRDKLARGSYLVDWRVLSADSHPIGGAFTFSVGAPGQQATGTGAGGDRAVGVLLGVSRLLTFVALALLVGAGAFLLTCWPAGRSRAGMRRLLFGSCAAAGVAAVAGLVLQGPYAAGLPLGDVADPQLLRTISASPYGHALFARLGLLALAGGWLVLFFRAGARRISRPVGIGGAVIGFGLLATLPLGGHANAGSQRPLALLADTGHLVAMSVWLGGLVVLAGLLVRPDRRVDLPVVVGRFSRVAFGSVLVLVGTGIYASVREVGSVVALMSTDYGKLLLLKVNLVLLVVGAAAISRAWTRRHRPAQVSERELDELVEAGERQLALAGAGSARHAGRDTVIPAQHAAEPAGRATGDARAPLELRSLRRSVLAEVVIAIGILAVTAVLVVTPPAKTAAPSPATNRAASLTTTRVAAGPVTVLVSPRTAGPRQLGIRLDTFNANAQVQAVPELTGALRLPSKGLGPLPVTLRPTGTGHFVADAVSVPVAGEWELSLKVRVTDFDSYSAQTTLAVR